MPAQRHLPCRREPPELVAPALSHRMISMGPVHDRQTHAATQLHLPATCSRKAVSDRFSSAAMLCSVASSSGCCSRQTAAGLPANLVEVKASTCSTAQAASTDSLRSNDTGKGIHARLKWGIRCIPRTAAGLPFDGPALRRAQAQMPQRLPITQCNSPPMSEMAAAYS